MPAGNNFSGNIVDWVTAESLRHLTNGLVIAGMFNSEYSRDYDKSFPVGETVRIPFPQRYLVRDGLGFTPQPINRLYTTVTCDQVFGIDFQMDSVENALKNIRDSTEVSKQYIKGPMLQLAQEIDSRAALWAYQNTNNIVGALGTNPTMMATYNAARARMVENACPEGPKRMIISPSMQGSISAISATQFNPTDAMSKTFRSGVISGMAAGFDEWYESMSLYTHTAGTWAGAVTVTTSGQSGSSLAVTCTTGDTFLKNDVITIAAVYNVNPKTRRSTGSLKQFRIVQSVTGAGSAATLTIDPPIVGPGSQYQNVDALPVAAAALTLMPGTTSPNGKTGVQGLALHGDAFAIVGVRLEEPKGSVEKCSIMRDPKTGISIRYLKQFLGMTSVMIERFDVLLGFGNLYNDQCAVRVESLT